MQDQPIGVFDSGMGGISVLINLATLMPHEHFIYYGDTQNAPYGTRPESEILDLTRHSADLLLTHNIKALVIACNTATSAAAGSLRAELTIPVVGMEPALKPAALAHPGERIIVMATPATLRQRKFQTLFSQYGQNAEALPCPGLMEFVEREELDSPALIKYLLEKLPTTGRPIKAIVLGCTHYVFLKPILTRLFPDVSLYDGNSGTAHQLMALLKARHQLNPNTTQGSIRLMSSGDESTVIPIMRRLFEKGSQEEL